MGNKVRIGAVSYLNTIPLVHGMKLGLGAERIELSFEVPSVLARQMAAGEIDIALLPVIALAEVSDLEIVPGLGITTQGPSRSVLLVSRKPVSEIGSVALDGESRTSNVLAQVLFAEVWNHRPEFSIGPRQLDQALAEHDAAVRIGDKALFESPPDGMYVHDRGQIWTDTTGLPFVFAAWTARRGVVDREIYQILHASRREGATAIDRIAAEFSWNGKRDPQLVRSYLLEHIHYRLGAAEVDAMRLFFEAASRQGLVERPPEIRLALRRWTKCHDSAGQAAPADPSLP
jgi:chorismate dehydratase